MIISLNLQNKKVCIVGGGNESLKRLTPLLKENCNITVISESINKQIKNLAFRKKILLKKTKLDDAKFLEKEKPFMIITTTNNNKLNLEILKKAKKMKIIAYSSDNPIQSDFSNPAIINYEKIIEIAVFTGGKSPIMSKKIKEQLEKSLKKSISREDIEQIKIQMIARSLVKNSIDGQNKRKEFLNSLSKDKKIKQLIKDGQGKKIEKHIIAMLRDWK